MNARIALFAPFLLMATVLAVASPADDEALKKDLTAVIALQGKPCGEVVDVKTQAANDYAASCKDGHKYRVYQNAQGRVIVEERK